MKRIPGALLVVLALGWSSRSAAAAPQALVIKPLAEKKVAELTAERLEMHATAGRNGVLILVVPGRREFHVWGDRAIHERVGDEFWKRVAGQISEQFQRGDFTAGLLSGIDEIGRQLGAHFPAQPGSAINSLPDSVVEE